VAAKALHGIRLNVRNIDLAQQFYTSLGMVEDIGMRRAGKSGEPPCVLANGDPAGVPRTPSVSLRWPSDPYMHLNLVARHEDSPTTGWPKAVDQLGSTVITLLVDDLDLELERLGHDGVGLDCDPVSTVRLLGVTRSAFTRDPDGNFLEILEAGPQPGWDYAQCSVVGAPRTFLHFQLNTYDLPTVSQFYAGFGFTHDVLSDQRQNVDYRQLIDMSGPNPYLTAFGQPLSRKVTTGVSLFRLPQDHSQMHLEIMGWVQDKLLDPGAQPTFHQRGVMRYCFKIRELSEALADLKHRGVRIFLENQLGAYGWGDSEWFYFGDPDGNLLCFEEWFPAGHWGERF
jgi:catechol 2,3-dioxygenase-like lactoylglutathione lyase family enzyme